MAYNKNREALILIAASKLTNVPVVDPESHSRLGVISQCIYDPERGVLVAFDVKLNSLLPLHQFLAFQDVQSFEHHAVIADEETLITLAELPRVQKIVQSKCSVMGQKAETSTKKSLGRVSEVMIDNMSGQIIQLHTQLLLSKRIFRFDDVVKITSRAVIIRNDLPLIKEQDAIPAEVSTA